MKRLALGVLAVAILASPVCAAPPVSIQNAANTATAVVDTNGLHVVLAGGTGTNQNVNLTQVGSQTVNTAGVNGAQGVGGTSANGATDDGSYPVKAGCIVNTTLPAYTNGQRGTLQCTTQGGLLFDDITHPYVHITTATTTLVKSGAGSLHQVIINTKASAAATATIYDNTTGSGTVIAVLDLAANDPVTINYDVSFSTGLTIVTTATCDLTVTYR